MTYRDDLEAAIRKGDVLEQENTELRARVKELESPPEEEEPKMRKCEECGGWFARTGLLVFGLLTGLGAGAGLAFLLYTVVTENGATDRCYVEAGSGGLIHELRREVNWGGDRHLGSYKDVPSALADAERLGCSEVR